MVNTNFGSILSKVVLGVLILSLQGCAGIDLPTTVGSGLNYSSGQSSSNKDCGSNKATIAVADFENKAGRYSRLANAGLATKLSQKLFKTGCFQVVHRDKLKQIMREIGFSQSGLARPGSVSRLGRQVGADLLVFGVVTQFDHKKHKGKKSLYKESSRIEANITMTGVENGVVLVSETVVGNGSISNLFKASSFLGQVLEADTQSTPNRAIDDMLNNAVPLIVAGMPSMYEGRSVRKFKKKDSDSVLAQQVMQETGFYSGGIDGDWGPMSRRAMKEFQQQFDLSATGELDDQTMQKIRELKN